MKALTRRTVRGALALAGTVFLAASASAGDTDDDTAGDAKSSGSAEPADSDAADESGSKDADKETDDAATEPTEAPAQKAVSAGSDTELPAARPFARFWVGVAGSLDLAFATSGKDVCVLDAGGQPVASHAIYCTNPAGSDFPDRRVPIQNTALVPGRSGALDGGVKIGDVRLLVAADYAITGSILAGIRLGYVMNSYPGDFALNGRASFLRNVHLEARGTYVFGKDPLARVAFAPVAFAGLGFAPTDAHAQTSVAFAGVRGTTPMNAWQVGGPGLFVLGGGARYGFSSRSAFTLAWKLELAFGSASPLFAMGPELAFQVGF